MVCLKVQVQEMDGRAWLDPCGGGGGEGRGSGGGGG